MLPQFEVVELIGQGGMGAVYKARQPRLDRFVAIKLLPSFNGADEHSFGERFEREARAMARLSHPSIVMVHDFGETEDGHKYIVMEYVDGSDLHTLIHSGHLTVRHAMSWIPQICEALQYAHDHDVIHRDIKPANILINQEGVVKVGDFGLAKLVGRKHENAITRTQMSMGTPDYAAPEALDEDMQVDTRGDIYSVGVLFYEILTGKVPRGAWRPPSDYVDIDSRIDQIVIKAMQPDPSHRYQQVSQISQALSEIHRTPKMVLNKGSESGSSSRPKMKMGEARSSLGDRPSSARKITRRRTPAVTGGGRTTRPESLRRSRREQMDPLLVAGIAVGSVFVFIGLIILLLTTNSNNSSPGNPSSGGAAPTPIVQMEETETSVPMSESEATPATSPNRPERPGKGLRPPDPEAGPVDLIASMEKGMDLMDGWERTEEGTLSLMRQEGVSRISRCLFPVTTGFGWDASFEIRPAEARGMIGVFLPVGRSGVVLVMDRTDASDQVRIALSQVDGLSNQDAENPTVTTVSSAALAEGKLTVRAITRPDMAAIGVALDGQGLIQWTGSPDALKPPLQWDNRRGRVQFLMMGSSMDVTIASATLASLPREMASDPEVAIGEAFAKAPLPPAEMTEPEPVVPEPEEPMVDLMAVLNLDSNTLAGEWMMEGESLNMMTPGAEGVRPRLQIGRADGSYTLEAEFQRNALDGNIVLVLPVSPELHATLHLNARGRVLGLGGIGGLEVASPENPTRREIDLGMGEAHILRVDVDRQSDQQVAILAELDGEVMFDWSGTLNDLRELNGDWPVPERSGITLGATAPVSFSALRARGLADEAPGTPNSGLTAADLRIKELRARHEGVVAGTVGRFQDAVARIDDNYSAKLEQLITEAQGSSRLLEESALNGELERLKSGQPLESTDSAELPEIVQQARSTYRELVQNLEKERDTFILNSLREYASGLDTLRLEYVNLGNEPAADRVTETRSLVDTEIDRLVTRYDPSAAEPQLEDVAGLAPTSADSSGKLEPFPYPPVVPTETGEIVILSRRDGDEDEPDGVGEIPAEVQSGAVAISGGANVVAALMPNGTVDLWGDPVMDSSRVAANAFRRIAALDVCSSQSGRIHLAVLSREGSVEILTQGWRPSQEAAAQLIVEDIRGACAVAVTATGGLALLQTGEVVHWGDQDGFEEDDLVRVFVSDDLQIGLREDGSMVREGGFAPVIHSMVTHAVHVAISKGARPGLVAVLPENKVITFGSFVSAQPGLIRLAETERITELRGGYGSFAARTEDETWHFFGESVPSEETLTMAKGCKDVVITRNYVLGLRPLLLTANASRS